MLGKKKDSICALASLWDGIFLPKLMKDEVRVKDVAG
jgi:hypothetical protein